MAPFETATLEIPIHLLPRLRDRLSTVRVTFDGLRTGVIDPDTAAAAHTQPGRTSPHSVRLAS